MYLRPEKTRNGSGGNRDHAAPLAVDMRASSTSIFRPQKVIESSVMSCLRNRPRNHKHIQRTIPTKKKTMKITQIKSINRKPTQCTKNGYTKFSSAPSRRRGPRNNWRELRLAGPAKKTGQAMMKCRCWRYGPPANNEIQFESSAHPEARDGGLCLQNLNTRLEHNLRTQP